MFRTYHSERIEEEPFMTIHAVRPVIRLVLGLCIAAVPAAIASATTYYVSTTGSNTNDGLTTTSAWRNVQYTANHVVAGYTVQVLGGTYNETVNISPSGSATAGYLTFQKYAGPTAIVDGTGLSIPNGQYGLFNIASQSYLIIQGFEIRNYKTTVRNQVPVGVYVTGAGSHLQLLNNHVHDIVTTAS